MARRQVIRQSDFGFGELSDTYAASNIEAKSKSLKSGLNTRILNSFAFGQRYGSRWLVDASGVGINFEIVTSNGTSLVGIARAGGVDIYSTDGALIQSVSGAPWSADEAQELVWHARQDEVYFTHQSYWPRLLSVTAGVWSIDLFDFEAGAGGSSQQPYYRFERPGIELLPSATSGSINVVFSDDVLVAAHQGVRFRYGSTLASAKEMEITAVLDAQNATATVIDELPPTFTVTVADASGYRIGEDVQGLDSQAAGVITDISGSDLTVLMSDNYASFDVAGTEYIVGPYHRSKVSAVSVTDPAPSTVWDEAALSPARGYPGAVFERSGRLGFTDFPEIPGAVVMSAPGARHVFDVGKGEPQDAIFFVLEEGGQRIRYGISAANLILLTDRNVYFVPEDENAPLSAATFTPTKVGPTGTSSAFPVIVEEGVVFVERGGNRIMGLLTTGDTSAPFRLEDLSKHADHLIKNPVSLAMTNGNAQAPERYVFALNEDGTLTCIFFSTNPPRLGLTPWETDGAWLAMASINGIIYAVCRRTFGVSDTYSLERLDAEVQMDASTLFATASAGLYLTDESDDTIDGEDGPIGTDAAAVPHLANRTVKVIRGTEYLGEFTVSAEGTLSGIDAADGSFEAGLHFNMPATLWPPEAEGDGNIMFARRKIDHAAIRVKDSVSYTVGIEGRDLVNVRPSYDQGDDLEDAPPTRSEVKRWPMSGWLHEPCLQITRPLPQPLTVLGVAQEVSFK